MKRKYTTPFNDEDYFADKVKAGKIGGKASKLGKPTGPKPKEGISIKKVASKHNPPITRQALQKRLKKLNLTLFKYIEENNIEL